MAPCCRLRPSLPSLKHKGGLHKATTKSLALFLRLPSGAEKVESGSSPSIPMALAEHSLGALLAGDSRLTLDEQCVEALLPVGLAQRKFSATSVGPEESKPTVPAPCAAHMSTPSLTRDSCMAATVLPGRVCQQRSLGTGTLGLEAWATFLGEWIGHHLRCKLLRTSCGPFVLAHVAHMLRLWWTASLGMARVGWQLTCFDLRQGKPKNHVRFHQLLPAPSR